MVTGAVLGGVGHEVEEEEAIWVGNQRMGGWQIPAAEGGIVTPGGEKEGNRGMEYSGF